MGLLSPLLYRKMIDIEARPMQNILSHRDGLICAITNPAQYELPVESWARGKACRKGRVILWNLYRGSQEKR